MSVIIEGLNLPRKDSGEYFVHPSEVKGVEVGVVVMTLMIDQNTQGLRVSLWNPEKYGLKESYSCVEIEPDDDLIDAEVEMRLMQSYDYDTYEDYSRAFDMLDNAPKIIPAETGE